MMGAAVPGDRLGASVQDRVSETNAAERQAALRALLSRPMLGARGSTADQFALVRRHADWLRQWLAENCGWGLHLDSEFARLRKVPADVNDGTRGAVGSKSGAPFNRRKYVLLCLGLASLERGDRQITLGGLAKEIMALIAADPEIARAGIAFDLQGREQRSDLVQMVRYLLELRVLERVDGDEQQFLKDAGDVLYGVNRPVLAMMLNLMRGPTAIDPELPLSARMQQLIEEQRADTDEAHNRELHTRLTRRLLDDPVIYFDDLDAAELDYLNRHRSQLLRRVEEATGLIAEVRAEGIAMVDDRGDLTDLEMPRDGTDAHFTLLLAQFLAQKVREGRSTRVGMRTLHDHAATLVGEHAGHWRKSVQESGAIEVLVADAIARLEALRLVVRDGEGVAARPAIARYGIGDVDASKPETRARSQKTLWGPTS